MLSRDDILGLLDELANRLESQGLHGDLFLVGGAAMALAYNARRATRDLDGVFEPKQVVYHALSRSPKNMALPRTGSTTASRPSCPATIPTPQCSSIALDCLYESRLLVT
jgi:hypothetical protein